MMRQLTLGARKLRQRVDRMAAVQHASRRKWCAAARCRTGLPTGACSDSDADPDCPTTRAHILGDLPAFHLCGAFEKGAGGLVQRERES